LKLFIVFDKKIETFLWVLVKERILMMFWCLKFAVNYKSSSLDTTTMAKSSFKLDHALG
jgi:hypothetical protein